MSAPAESTRAEDGWSLIALVPHDGQEPPASLSDELARSVWCAVSAIWHPSLLAARRELPRIESIESPIAARARARSASSPATRAIGFRPATGRRPRTPAPRCSMSGTDRADLIGRIQARMGVAGATDVVETEPMAAASRDFLALGTARWMLRDLTVGDGARRGRRPREPLARADGRAHAWQLGDCQAAANRLRAGFEVLTQARERFYPVDAYLLDLCLLDPSMPAGVLAEPLATAVADHLHRARPGRSRPRRPSIRDGVAALRQAITDGWADVAGGTYSEAEDALLPLESILWQFARGGDVYRAHLDERSVETFARRRFGLFVQLPQIAKRFGIRYALHMSFDGGRFPIRAGDQAAVGGSGREQPREPAAAADRRRPRRRRAGGSPGGWRRRCGTITSPRSRWSAGPARWHPGSTTSAAWRPIRPSWAAGRRSTTSST